MTPVRAGGPSPSTSAQEARLRPIGEAAAFLCGAFGDEQPPGLMAIDLATATTRWRTCPEQLVPATILARAVGATILLQQDGHGRAEAVAIDDEAVKRRRRPVRLDEPRVVVAGSTVVVVGAVVEGIEASTGTVRWTHPVADGTPVGDTDDVVVEVDGGPYTLSTEVAGGRAGAGSSTVRALDAATGSPRWSREVELGPVSALSPFGPTVTASTVVVPGRDGTAYFDIATGGGLGVEPGEADGLGAVVEVRSSLGQMEYPGPRRAGQRQPVRGTGRPTGPCTPPGGADAAERPRPARVQPGVRPGRQAVDGRPHPRRGPLGGAVPQRHRPVRASTS